MVRKRKRSGENVKRNEGSIERSEKSENELLNVRTGEVIGREIRLKKKQKIGQEKGEKIGLRPKSKVVSPGILKITWFRLG